jgi:hypothetical protein
MPTSKFTNRKSPIEDSSMARFLRPQLRCEHVPQREAQSDRKVWLDDSEIKETDEPGDEDQGSVVKDVVGNQQKEEGAKCCGHTPQEARQAEKLGANPKTMYPHSNEKRSRHNHDEGSALLTQEPMLAPRYPLLEGTHHRQPREESVD